MAKPYNQKFRILCLLLCLSLPLWGQEFPGGELHYRDALRSERGSHPRIVLQTVLDATTTSTSLVIRHSERGKQSPPSCAAHLLEHLQFRTQYGEGPGELLFRNELLGNQTRAWTSPELIVYTEEVPAENGLESLGLQLSRLRGVPTDSEGLELEKDAIVREAQTAQSPEENARRTILKGLGYAPGLEGSARVLRAIDADLLEKLLAGISLEDDVVIAVVGPHPPRELRRYLSKSLKKLAPSRKVARKPNKDEFGESPKLRKMESARAYHQDSYFFHHQFKDPRSPQLLRSLLQMRAAGSQANLEREARGFYRLDLPADADFAQLSRTPSEEEAQSLLRKLRREWLDENESLSRRAETLAISKLYGLEPAGMVTEAALPALMAELEESSSRLLEDAVKLEIRKKKQSKSRSKFFPFRTHANRESQGLVRDRLPNQLGITRVRQNSFPLIAISGFFRITPALSAEQASALQKTLRAREDLELQYEVKPGGLFYHAWAETGQASELLREAAKELRRLATEEKSLLAESAPKRKLIDEFFLGPGRAKQRKLSGESLIRPSRGHLVIVGQFTERQVEEGLRPAWSGWFDTSSPPPIYAKSESEETDLVPSKTIKGSSSPVLLLAFSGPDRASPDFLAFNLALQTLAGRPVSSILERKLGAPVSSAKVFPLTSSLGQLKKKNTQLWLVALRLNKAVSDPAPIAKKTEALLQDLAKEELSERDLDRTRSFLKSSLKLSASTIRGRAKVLAHSEFFRLNESYAKDFAGLYEHLDPSTVRAVCMRYFSKPELRWLYLKP